MCGICGIIAAGDAPVDESMLRRMNSMIVHRGPDDAGYYSEPGVGLAMRRLSIIDVEGSRQPIANEDESVRLVFNGEIHNYKELRSRLRDSGHHYRTDGDAESIAHLYEEHGCDCVKHLSGQFSFALWDRKLRRLLLARDRFGEKPLYYTVQNNNLYFASELSAITGVLENRPPISLPSIDMFLALQYIPEPATIYEGIYKLPAGHYLSWVDGAATIERYWDLSYEPKHSGTERELAEELVSRTRVAVERTLVSDVPLGAHLSGGIDSSIIVALMSEAGRGKVKTFSAGFHEQGFSELEYARAVADRYGTDHHEFILEYGDIPATLTDILQHVGEPFADSSCLPLYHLARLTREHVTVALNGDGGDELFAGYLRHRLDPWVNVYTGSPALLQKVMISAIRPFHDNADKPIGRGIVNGLKRLEQLSSTDKRASILRWGSYFSRNRREELWTPEAKAHIDLSLVEGLLTDMYERAPAIGVLDRTLYMDIRTYLPGDLLVKSDRMTMAHSLEGRSPFLDHELAEWAARLPRNMKIRGRTGKYLLRKAFAHMLPDKIKMRGKQGFGVPVGAWLRKPLAKWSEELLLSGGQEMNGWFRQSTIETLLAEHQSGRADHGRRLWALVCLAVWLESRN